MLTILNILTAGLQLAVIALGLGWAWGSSAPGFGLLTAAAGALGFVFSVLAVFRSWRFRSDSLVLGRTGHELRTPLAVLTAWADQYREPGDRPDPEVLDRQIRRMRVMVEGTLEGARRLVRTRTPAAPCLTRTGSGLALTRVVGDLAALWPPPEAVFPDLPAGGIGVPRLQWRLEGLEGLRQAPGDDRFHHILANLLQNAFRHGIPRARPLVRPWLVTATLRVRGPVLEAVVEDEGPGVRVLFLTGLPRSLDPENRRGTGTGLGFALVRDLAATAGGSVVLGSRSGAGRPPRGTRVTVVLPIEEVCR